MGYEIVRYRPEFKDGVLKLLESLWTPIPAVNAACLEWKYERNPYHNQPLLYLALDRGRVVGMRGMAGAKWEAGIPQQQFVIPCACDLVIAPDHRNRGLISKIVRFAFDDLKKRGTEYIFNLSAGSVTFVNSLVMGWRSIGPLQKAVWVDTETPRERLKRLLRRWPSALRLAKSIKNQPFLRHRAHIVPFTALGDKSPFRHLDRNFQAGKRASGGQIFLERSPRSEAMADLVERIGSDGRIRHVRDAKYFAWRFECPLSTYRFLYWGQSKLEGYLVLGTRSFPAERTHSRAIVSDWEATSLEVFEALIMTAIRLGEFDALEAWEKAIPRPAREVLKVAGFRPENEVEGRPQYRPTVLVRPTGDEKNPAEWRLADGPLLDVSRWDMRPLCSL